MNRDRWNNRLRGYGRRPLSDGVLDRWEVNGLDAGRQAAYAGLPEAEELGPTLTRPFRYRSLLVPLDGSAFGEHALPLALGIARRAGAPVRLVHVHSSVDPAGDPGQLYLSAPQNSGFLRNRQAYLDGLVRRLAKVSSVPVSSVLLDGPEVATSLCEAASWGADLVVMATHRRGPLGRLWHGSVAGELMRRLTAPLLLVRGYETPVDLTGDPAIRQVLMPLDGSEAAEQILRPALALGTLTGAEHTLLRVVRQTVDLAVGYGPVGTGQPITERTQAEAWGGLRRLARGLGGAAARVDPRLLVAEQPVAASVLWYARKREADLIALTTRGRGPLSRLLRRSVADQVVRRADVPVLVLRVDG